MRTIKKRKVVNSKKEHKRYWNDGKGCLWCILSLVQSLNNANIVGSYDYPSSAIKNHSQVPISGEQKIEIVCRVRNHLKAILSDQSILEFILK